MALLAIISAPDPRLKAVCTPVAGVDDDVRRLMDDMLETMYRAPGIGLAAPQVGIRKRVLVVDIGREREADGDGDGGACRPLQMANPELAWVSDETWTHEEGCLSLPEHYADVTRPERVRVRYLDYHGAEREIEAERALATCIQHEMDHLDGILFVDHISILKRSIILRKLAKAQRADANAGA